jgi:peptide/nickel transport system substrate-binding protein
MKSLILLLLLTFPLSAYAIPHDTLTIGVPQFPNTFHPGTDSSAIKDYIISMAHPDLTTFDKDWQVVCLLCTSLPNEADGTARTVTDEQGKAHIEMLYTLPAAAKWADGVPLTTADIMFSLEVGRSPKSGYAAAELYHGDSPSAIASITPVDEHSFWVRLNGVPCDYQAALNDFHIIPEHIERPVFAADPDLYRLHSKYSTAPETPGLWYGPYMITHVERGSTVVLARNPFYWGKRPVFNQVTVRAFENTSTLESALLAGEVDYLPGEVGVPEHIAASIAKKHGDRFDVVFKPSLVDQHIDLNQNNKILQDVRVRKALLYAIDRQTIDDAIYDGQYLLETSFVAPLDSVFSKDVTLYGYDPVAAGKLLDEAGWTGRDHDIRTNAAGEHLGFVISTTAGDQRREELEQALIWYWRQIGAEVRVKNEPARILFGQSLPQRKYEGAALYSWMMAPRNVPRQQYACQAIPSADNGYAGQNFIGWCDPQFDQLLDRMETQCQPTENQAAWTEAQQMYTEQLPSLPLFYRTDAFVIPKWLHGIQPTGHQYPTTLWIEDWTVSSQ